MGVPLVRSRKILRHARNQPCTLSLVGICNHDPATTVFAHFRDQHRGMGIKAADYVGCYACFECHRYLDETHGRAPEMSNEELYQAMLRAMVLTIGILIRDHIIFVPQDELKQRKPATRKPKHQRAQIPSHRSPWPPKGSRSIRSANNLAGRSKKDQ